MIRQPFYKESRRFYKNIGVMEGKKIADRLPVSIPFTTTNDLQISIFGLLHQVFFSNIRIRYSRKCSNSSIPFARFLKPDLWRFDPYNPLFRTAV